LKFVAICRKSQVPVPTYLTHEGTNNNKKSQLMFMRRARAYSSSLSQVVLVYLSISSLFTFFAAENRKEDH